MTEHVSETVDHGRPILCPFLGNDARCRAAQEQAKRPCRFAELCEAHLEGREYRDECKA
jgi:hypothetical protein